MKMTIVWMITAAALLSTTLFAAADVTQKKALTLDGARKVVAGAMSEAKRLKTTAAIAVVDDGGNVLALERIDGTFPASSNISIGKARTAPLFQRESKVFEETVNKGRASMIALSGVALEAFTPLQGGVPIMSGGQVVGAVGVSGAGPGVAWFPLGPHEVWFPPYRSSRAYVTNITHTVRQCGNAH